MKINKEYIERRALLNEIEEIRPLNWTDTEAEITEQLDYDIFENLVKSRPTADVQEVVRCKDCIHCCMSYDPKTNTSRQICGYVGYNPVQSSEVTDYDFCSKGERMIDSENNV